MMAAVSKKILANAVKTEYFRFISRSLSLTSTVRRETPEDHDPDKPVKFSTSKAATWKAESSFSGNERENVSPWYQPLVVSGSLLVFMIYFGILREENDVDEQLNMSLFDRVDGLEEAQLNAAINYYKQHEKGHDTSKLEERLAELRAMRSK